jgi:hypothetical protein
VGKETRERIEMEIAEGKLGIARDRLHGLVTTYPGDMTLRSRLGDVYAKLGYPLEAGRYWFLDEKLDDEKRAAIDRFIEHCGRDPAKVFRGLRLRTASSSLDTAWARERVARLVADCEARGVKVETHEPRPDVKEPVSLAAFGWACSLFGAAVLFLALVGLVSLFDCAR